MNFNLADLEAIERMPRYYRWKRDLVVPHLPPAARVLEVGCGTGLFMEQIAPLASFTAGIDPDAACIEVARRRFAGRSGTEVRTMGVLDPASTELAGLKLDAVVFVSSLEVIADDTAALARSRSWLRPGGRLVVFVSALPGLAGHLDSAWNQHRYEPAELRQKVEAAGFAVTRLRYVNLLGAAAWWWDSRILKRTEVTATDYGSRDRLVPLARLADALTGPPIGRSLLAVATAR